MISVFEAFQGWSFNGSIDQNLSYFGTEYLEPGRTFGEGTKRCGVN